MPVIRGDLQYLSIVLGISELERPPPHARLPTHPHTHTSVKVGSYQPKQFLSQEKLAILKPPDCPRC